MDEEWINNRSTMFIMIVDIHVMYGTPKSKTLDIFIFFDIVEFFN